MEGFSWLVLPCHNLSLRKAAPGAQPVTEAEVIEHCLKGGSWVFGQLASIYNSDLLPNDESTYSHLGPPLFTSNE